MGAIAEAMAEYARPLFEQTDGSPEQMSRAMAMSQFCFNTALLSNEARAEAIAGLKSRLSLTEEEFDDLERNLIMPMIERHEKMFSGLHQPGMRGFISSTITPRQPLAPTASTQKFPGTKPYVPCPCNSGRKYRFCCGRPNASRSAK